MTQHRQQVPVRRPRPSPLRWITAGLVALGVLALAVIALARGSSSDSPPEITLDQEYRNDQLSMRITSAELLDFVPGATLDLKPGEDVVLVTLIATNLSSRTLSSLESVVETFRIAHSPDQAADLVQRTDDATQWPYLQPDVAAPITLGWIVQGESLAQESSLRIAIRDQRLEQGSFVISGTYWWGDEISAYLTVPLAGGGSDT